MRLQGMSKNRNRNDKQKLNLYSRLNCPLWTAHWCNSVYHQTRHGIARSKKKLSREALTTPLVLPLRRLTLSIGLSHTGLQPEAQSHPTRAQPCRDAANVRAHLLAFCFNCLWSTLFKDLCSSASGTWTKYWEKKTFWKESAAKDAAGNTFCLR